MHSYVVARDFGFAPNPFYGVCTLATCKPVIRKTAQVGDWIVGTGSARNGMRKNIIFAMRVSEYLSFDQYWNDARFEQKKPNLFGSKRKAFGDNIYHRSSSGKWMQESSHHSHADGSPNVGNIRNDTQADRVLVGSEFIYWGEYGPTIPSEFRQPGNDVRAVRGHKNNFDPSFVSKVIAWLKAQPEWGQIGRPLDWRLPPKTLKT